MTPMHYASVLSDYDLAWDAAVIMAVWLLASLPVCMAVGAWLRYRGGDQ